MLSLRVSRTFDFVRVSRVAGKWLYRELLAELKSNLSADTSQVLDGLLIELTVRPAVRIWLICVLCAESALICTWYLAMNVPHVQYPHHYSTMFQWWPH